MKAIRESTGKNVIFFNGHGGKNHVWLDHGTVRRGIFGPNEKGRRISYMEMGDALLGRQANGQSIGDVKILLKRAFLIISASIFSATFPKMERKHFL